MSLASGGAAVGLISSISAPVHSYLLAAYDVGVASQARSSCDRVKS